MNSTKPYESLTTETVAIQTKSSSSPTTGGHLQACAGYLEQGGKLTGIGIKSY